MYIIERGFSVCFPKITPEGSMSQIPHLGLNFVFHLKNRVTFLSFVFNICFYIS